MIIKSSIMTIRLEPTPCLRLSVWTSISWEWRRICSKIDQQEWRLVCSKIEAGPPLNKTGVYIHKNTTENYKKKNLTRKYILMLKMFWRRIKIDQLFLNIFVLVMLGGISQLFLLINILLFNKELLHHKWLICISYR